MDYQGIFMRLPVQVKPDESHPHEINTIPVRPQHSSFDWRLHRPSALGDMQRHWCPRSERYAGVDALFTAFDHGWRIIGTIYRDEYRFSKTRHTVIYYFQLWRDDVVRWMPVLSTPYLSRQIICWNVTVTPIHGCETCPADV